MEKELKELNENLDKVSGGNEPEEFDWKPTGYTTPIKENDSKGWAYSAIGDKENNKDNG